MLTFVPLRDRQSPTSDSGKVFNGLYWLEWMKKKNKREESVLVQDFGALLPHYHSGYRILVSGIALDANTPVRQKFMNQRMGIKIN